LYHPDEFTRILQVRRQLASHPGWEALELLLRNIRRTQNNAELLIGGLTDKK
jgi:transcription termination factor Rho